MLLVGVRTHNPHPLLVSWCVASRSNASAMNAASNCSPHATHLVVTVGAPCIAASYLLFAPIGLTSSVLHCVYIDGVRLIFRQWLKDVESFISFGAERALFEYNWHVPTARVFTGKYCGLIVNVTGLYTPSAVTCHAAVRLTCNNPPPNTRHPAPPGGLGSWLAHEPR